MVAATERRPKKIPKTHYWKGKLLPPIFFEDPEPVEDGMLQQPTIDRVGRALKDWFPQHFVSTGGFIMPDPEDGNNRFSPDTFISFDVDWDRIIELEIPNYWSWVVGKLPEFALEVASPSTSKRDTDFKRGLYLRLGFREYLMLDNTGDLYGKPIAGLRRVGNRWEEYPVNIEPDGSQWLYSELLGLEFWWLSDGPVWDPFDVRDPRTGKSICIEEILEDERQALAAERQARAAAQREAREQRDARIAKRDALADERQARIAAERRVQELLRRIECLEEEEEED